MRGGRREGAGRKPGSATRRTREVAERAVAEGITPLEYMLSILREPEPEEVDPETRLAWRSLRFEAARASAPYIHPRLAPVGSKVIVPGLEGSLVGQGAAALRALAQGQLSPDVAVTVLQALATQTKLIETEDLEKRISALEAAFGGR